MPSYIISRAVIKVLVKVYGRGNIKKLLKRYGIKPKKRLGQSFLASESYARLIVNYCLLNGTQRVYEIGAGLGALTLKAAEKSSYVIAVEIDRRISQALRDICQRSYYNVDVVVADALHLGIPIGIDRVLSNVPYSISSQLLIMLVKSVGRYDLAVLTLQQEFAERLFARPREKKYCRLTILTSLLCNVERLASVPGNAFYPPSAVNSIVVRISPKPTPAVNAELVGRVEDFTRKVFPYKRKKLRKALRIAGIGEDFLVGSRLSKLLDKRVIELTPEEVVQITQRLYGTR